MNQNEVAQAISSQDEVALMQELLQFLEEGGTLKTLKNISDSTLETLYAQAYGLFQGSQYQDAEKTFQLLCFLNHYDQRFFMGVGLCRQRMNDFEQAIVAFTAAGLLDVHNPQPPFCAAECHLQLKQWTQAQSGFFSAAHLAANKPEYQILKNRAQKMLNFLAQQKQQEE